MPEVSSDVDVSTTGWLVHDRSVWHPQNNARMHSRLVHDPT